MVNIEDFLSFAESPDNRPAYTGTITAVSPNGASVKLLDGRTAVLPLGETPGQELPEVGETRQFLELDSFNEPAVLSLTHPALVSTLMAGIVPELRTGDLQVKGVSRLPGVRAKIAVASALEDFDPVAATVGRSANRVKHLSERLNGERVDIIPWHEDREQLLRNAFAPAEITEVKIDGRLAAVSVPAHRMSAAVGRGGLNASLAGRLAGLRVTVVREGGSLDEALAHLEAERQAAAA